MVSSALEQDALDAAPSLFCLRSLDRRLGLVETLSYIMSDTHMSHPVETLLHPSQSHIGQL